MGIFDFIKKRAIQPESSKTIDYKAVMDSFQKDLFINLKPLGFKKKGRTFNRQTEKGIYQVINLQSRQFPLGENYEIPGFRESYYGRFTVNLGVCVKELYDQTFPLKPKEFYQDYDCQIRIRLSDLIRGRDFWWTIQETLQEPLQEIVGGLRSKGFAWLDSYNTREKIINTWGENPDSDSPRAKLDVALMLLFSDREQGEILFRQYFAKIRDEKKLHKEYVVALAEEFGIDLKVP